MSIPLKVGFCTLLSLRLAVDEGGLSIICHENENVAPASSESTAVAVKATFTGRFSSDGVGVLAVNVNVIAISFYPFTMMCISNVGGVAYFAIFGAKFP